MNNKNNPLDIVANVIATATTVVQIDEILKWIQLGITIISIVFSIAFNLYRWYKIAKEDGKITKEEIKEGVEIIKDGTDKIKDALEEKEDKEDGDNN